MDWKKRNGTRPGGIDGGYGVKEGLLRLEGITGVRMVVSHLMAFDLSRA